MNDNHKINSIQVGTKVFCCLQGGRNGFVYAVHGKPAPETVQSICGVVMSGGRASFDIVWKDGNFSRNVSEAILQSTQWKIENSVCDEQELKLAVSFAEKESARKVQEGVQKAAAHDAELKRLRCAPEFANLAQGDDRYSGKLAAKNIRVQLKQFFPRVVFSVRKRSHGSIDISWTDGPTVAEVEKVAKAYQGGSFDGMNDMYVTEKSPWCETFGGAQYVFTSRGFSDNLLEGVIRQVTARHAEDGIPDSVTVEDFRSGRLISVQLPICGPWGQEDLGRLIWLEAGKVSVQK